jgi:hypothetical protein
MPRFWTTKRQRRVEFLLPAARSAHPTGGVVRCSGPVKSVSISVQCKFCHVMRFPSPPLGRFPWAAGGRSFAAVFLGGWLRGHSAQRHSPNGTFLAVSSKKLSPLVPSPKTRPPHVHSGRQKRPRFRTDLQLHRACLRRHGPGKSALFQTLDQHPKTGAIPGEHFQPGAAAV